MKKTTAVFSFFLLLFLFADARSQTPTPSPQPGAGIGCADCRSYKTPRMFLLKLPERTLSFEAQILGNKNASGAANSLTGKDAGTEEKWSVVLRIYSYDKDLKYLSARNNSPVGEKDQVRIFIDGKELKARSFNYFYLREDVKTESSVSFRSFQPQQKGGKILDEKGNEVTGTIGEVIFTSLALADFQLFNTARSAEISVGEEKFILNRDQIDEIKNITKNTVPR